MVNSALAHKRQSMLESKFEARAHAEREAQQREAALAAAAARAALVAESLALAESEGQTDPNFPVFDSAATPRSEASDTPRNHFERRPSSGGGTPRKTSLRVGRSASSPSARDSSAAAGGHSRKKGGGGSSAAMLEVEEGEGEVEGAVGPLGAPSRPSSGGKKKGLIGRLGGGFLSRRESKSSAKSKEDETAKKTGGLTEQERRDAKVWVEQAQKLEAALVPRIKTLERQKKDAKQDITTASKAIKDLEKLLAAPPKKDGKMPPLLQREAAEKMGKLELSLDDSEGRFEAAEKRIARGNTALATVSKLREWIVGQLVFVEIQSVEIVRLRLQELAALVSRESKEIASASSEVLVIKIHKTSPLEPQVNLLHPAILVSIVDETREPSDRDDAAKKKSAPGDYLLKQEDFGVAVQHNEGLSLSSGQPKGGGRRKRGRNKIAIQIGAWWLSPYFAGVDYALPPSAASHGGGSQLGTRGTSGGGVRNVRSIQAGVAPVWEEDVAIDQQPSHLLQDKVLYFFELVDFEVKSASKDADEAPSSHSSHARAQLNVWKRIAWAFYRPNLQGVQLDGSAASTALLRTQSIGSRVLGSSFSWRGTRVAPGPANSYRLPGGVGSRVALQLYRYHTPALAALRGASESSAGSHLAARCVALDSWRKFLQNPASFPLYPGTLDVTITYVIVCVCVHNKLHHPCGVCNIYPHVCKQDMRWLRLVGSLKL